VIIDPGRGNYKLYSNDPGLFLARLSNSGNVAWLRQFSSVKQGTLDNYISCSSIKEDSSNGLYVAGLVSGIADLNPGIGTYTVGQQIAFLARYTGDGEFLWTNRFKADALGSIFSIDIDPVNRVAISGDYYGQLQINPGNNIALPSPPPGTNPVHKLFLCLLDSSGRVIRTSNTGGGWMEGMSLHRNHIFTCGYSMETCDYDPTAGTFMMDPVNGPVYVTRFDLKDYLASVQEFENESIFSIYPNPASGKLIVSDSNNEVSVKIYDLMGKEVFSEKTKDKRLVLDFNNQPEGVYIADLSDDKDHFVKKIIIKR
jgi:hypothetical protein